MVHFIVEFPTFIWYNLKQEPPNRKWRDTMGMDYLEISQRVLGKLQHNRGTGDVHDHLTLDTWEWPQGVAV